MSNNLYKAFESLKADDSLKQNTRVFISHKTKAKKSFAFGKLATALVSVLLSFSILFFGYDFYSSKTIYIDIDVNPGIEILLNRYNRVIEVSAYNEEGELLLKDLNLKNKTYQSALDVLLIKLADLDYLNDDVLLTATICVADHVDAQGFLASFRVNFYQSVALTEKNFECDMFIVDYSTKEASHQQQLSPAKYLAIISLQELEPTLGFDDCRHYSIKEIRQRVHQHSVNQQNNNTDNHNSEHGDSGNNSKSSSSTQKNEEKDNKNKHDDKGKHDDHH